MQWEGMSLRQRTDRCCHKQVGRANMARERQAVSCMRLTSVYPNCLQGHFTAVERRLAHPVRIAAKNREGACILFRETGHRRRASAGW